MMLRKNYDMMLGVLLIAGMGCTPSDPNPAQTTDTSTGETEAGDGDGDPGDGDGDGDGDSGDGDPSGDGDGDGDGDPGCDFIPHPFHNLAAECEPILQDCPEGEKCVAVGDFGVLDNNKCVPVTGSKAPGEACSSDGIQLGTDDCDEQSQCFSLTDEFNGTCHAFCGCSYEMPECAENSSCLIFGDGSATLCVEQCDPLLQNCPPDQGCYAGDGELVCVPTTQDLPAGEICAFANDCVPGTTCSDQVSTCNGPECCTPFCDLEGDGSECAVLPGTTCQPVETWGLCL